MISVCASQTGSANFAPASDESEALYTETLFVRPKGRHERGKENEEKTSTSPGCRTTGRGGPVLLVLSASKDIGSITNIMLETVIISCMNTNSPRLAVASVCRGGVRALRASRFMAVERPASRGINV